MWEAFDLIERHAAAAKTLLAARVEESKSWERSGDRSAAEHLARKGGTTTGAARAGLETSKRLGRLPATEAALRRGELSQAQADTIAEAAAVNPSSEADLLATARTRGLGELRERARRAKAAGDPDPDATHRRLYGQRRLRRFTDGEGAWNVQARGTADAGAVFNASLDPIIDELFRAARREGRQETRDAYAFDALIELARRARGARAGASAASPRPDRQPAPAAPDPETAQRYRHTRDTPTPTDKPDRAGGGDRAASINAGDRVGTTGSDRAADNPHLAEDEATVGLEARGVAVGADPPTAKASRGTPNPTYLALLRVDVEALRRGMVEGDELCEIAGVGSVPARVARDLLGDSVAKLVVTRGNEVVNITHLGRGPTAAQRIALLWATPACTNEQCSNTLAIEHDHRTPWTRVRETATANLDRLCRPCHRRKTHQGWALVPGRGRRAFVAPDDPRHPMHARHRPDRSERHERPELPDRPERPELPDRPDRPDRVERAIGHRAPARQAVASPPGRSVSDARSLFDEPDDPAHAESSDTRSSVPAGGP